MVLNSFSSLKLQNSRPGEAGGGGAWGGGGGVAWGGGVGWGGVGVRVLPYKDSTGMCRAKAPNFSVLTTLLF